MRKLTLYNGRLLGKNYLFHEWLKIMVFTLKKGSKLGLPVEGGIAVFEFKGIRKPKSKLKFCGIDKLCGDKI